MDFGEDRKLWDGIERMYVLEPGSQIPLEFRADRRDLKDRLHRWTQGGQYGFLFDNVEDTLSFTRFQTFNFHGWDDAPEVLEPLLFYVLHRATTEIADPNKLATFKTVPAGRGVAVHKKRDHPQLRRTGAEDLA